MRAQMLRVWQDFKQFLDRVNIDVLPITERLQFS